jgi:hypothetical protein
MRKSFYFFAILIAASAVLLVTQLAKGKPRPLADTVTVSFLGYTNDSSGARIGLFKIMNPSPISIDLRRAHDVQIETTAGWASQGLQAASAAEVKPNQSTLLAVPAPSSKQRWRVWLNYENHRDIGAAFILGLKRLGLPISYKNQTYSACSDPVDP